MEDEVKQYDEILPQTEGPSNQQPQTKDWKFVNSHSQDQINGDWTIGVKTRSSFKDHVSYALFSEIEPKSIN